MTCSVDPTAWGEKNRIQLGTGKRQRWVLARTTRDNPTVDSLEMTARAVMNRWFPESTPVDVLFADAGTAVDDITIESVGESRPALGARDQRRESLDPLPMLAPGPTPPLYVALSFNYRGYAKSMPWPVWTESMSPLRESKLCPFDCDWMLVQAKATTELAAASEEKSGLEKLSQHGPGGLADLAQLTRLAGYGLIALFGAQLWSLSKPYRRGS